MIGNIRRMYLRDKLSLHEITKHTGISRNTIRRWLRNTEEAAPPKYRRSKQPGKLSTFQATLEQADHHHDTANTASDDSEELRLEDGHHLQSNVCETLRIFGAIFNCRWHSALMVSTTRAR